MEIEETLVTYLKTHAGLAGLVAARIYPLQLPQSPTLPALVYTRVSGARTHTQSWTPVIARPRIQFDCWAATYSGAKALAAQLRAALDGYHATADTWGSRQDNDIDILDDDTGRYRVVVDIIVIHSA